MSTLNVQQRPEVSVSSNTSDSDSKNEFFDSDEYQKNVSRPSLEPAKLRYLQQQHSVAYNTTTPAYANINTANNTTTNNNVNKPLPSIPGNAPPYAIPTSANVSNTSASSSNTANVYTNNSSTVSKPPAVAPHVPSKVPAVKIPSNVPVYAAIDTKPLPVPAVKPLTNTSTNATSSTTVPNTTKSDPSLPASVTYTGMSARGTTSSSVSSSNQSSNASSPNTSLRHPIAPVQLTTPTSHITARQHSTPVASYTTFKNLDTGESYQSFDEMKSRYPETLTIDQYEQTQYSDSSSRSTSRNQSVSTPSESDREHSDTTISEKRNNLGYRLERMFKQALHIGTESSDNDVDNGNNNNHKQSATIKSKVKRKNYQELTQLNLVQTISQHQGPIWTFAISYDGQYIATGGQDSTVRVWAVMGSAAAQELEQQYKNTAQQPSTPSANSTSTTDDNTTAHSTPTAAQQAANAYAQATGTHKVLYPVPYRIYLGHKADIVDLTWSKANFLLSASIDKTVRLWHISRPKCLCLFQHSDFVTAVAFHPVEDRYFLSASFDKKLRVWNIPEHRVVEWTQTSTIITSCAFSPNGQLTVAGLYNGQCIFYATDGLKYYTQVECRNRHGKYKKGKKVTGLQFTSDGKQLLVTTNDSRIRLYDMDDYRVVAKFKGCINDELQIRAYFDETARYIICGSENECVYIWNTQNASGKVDSVEYFKACADTVTSSRFLPRSTIRTYTSVNTKPIVNHASSTISQESTVQHCIIAVGYNGEIKMFENTGTKKQV